MQMDYICSEARDKNACRYLLPRWDSNYTAREEHFVYVHNSF